MFGRGGGLGACTIGSTDALEVCTSGGGTIELRSGGGGTLGARTLDSASVLDG